MQLAALRSLIPRLSPAEARVRARGWIYSSGEALDGVKAIGAPVRDASGVVCAGVGVTFPAILLPKSRMQYVVRLVVEAARVISSKLGYPPLKLAAPAKQASSPRRKTRA